MSAPQSPLRPAVDQTLTADNLSPDQRDVYDRMIRWAHGAALRTGGGAQSGSILTVGGYAGSGKSTLLGVFASQFKGLAAYVTYTGRAASVLQRKLRAAGIQTTTEPLRRDRSGEITAGHPTMPLCSTIHSLLYRPIVDPVTEEIRGWEKRDKLDRSYALIVVDEASMVSDEILLDIRKHGVPLLAVGDHGQLPPVAAKGDLMQNPALRLEKIHRQAEGSPIIALSKHIREGGRFSNYKGPTGGALRFLFKAEIVPVLKGAYQDVWPLDVGVICWTNRMRTTLNRTIRDMLGHKGQPRAGEVLICLRNRAPVYNGMRGILEYDVEAGAKSWLLEGSIGFPDEGLAATYYSMCGAQFNRDKTFSSIEELAERHIHVDKMSAAGSLFDFGYALTCHKSQGSQFAHAILFCDRPEKPDDEDSRRFFYTAVTRAAENLTVIR
jgi:exodeoxyribonuclease V